MEREMKDFESFIDSLAKLVSFRSVVGSGERGMPFGKGIYSALEYYLSLAKSFGFDVTDYDGYIGEVTFGEGEELGIIGHLDVVPEGDGWNTDPYELTFKDGAYYGRGVLDDKAPMLLMLYILKELKESGISVNRKFRLFVGCDEETGWKDAEYFRINHGFPKYGFSPDGDFPVSYAEKGIAVAEFKLPLLKNHSGVRGGTVINAVCGRAFVTDKKSGKELTFNGKACHGSEPSKGINAIKLMYEYLSEKGEDVKEILDWLFYDKAGVFDLKCENGNVTFSPDVIEERSDGIYIKCDCRFPYPFTEKDLKKKFDTFGIPYTLTVKHGTQFVAKDGFLVKTLLDGYNAVTGENAKPVSLGGSTFARVFEQGVAFGPEIPNEPSTIHQPNECVTKENLLKIYNVYRKTVFDLAK